MGEYRLTVDCGRWDVEQRLLGRRRAKQLLGDLRLVLDHSVRREGAACVWETDSLDSLMHALGKVDLELRSRNERIDLLCSRFDPFHGYWIDVNDDPKAFTGYDGYTSTGGTKLRTGYAAVRIELRFSRRAQLRSARRRLELLGIKTLRRGRTLYLGGETAAHAAALMADISRLGLGETSISMRPTPGITALGISGGGG